MNAITKIYDGKRHAAIAMERLLLAQIPEPLPGELLHG